MQVEICSDRKSVVSMDRCLFVEFHIEYWKKMDF